MEDILYWFGVKPATNTPTTMAMTTKCASISGQQGASRRASSEAVDVRGLIRVRVRVRVRVSPREKILRGWCSGQSLCFEDPVE
jgi:hypothetical protein